MTEVFHIKDATQGPWDLDLGSLMIPEALELKRYTGYSPRGWLDALGDDDPLAVRFAFYLARKRAGEEVQFGDVDCNLFTLSIVMAGGEDEEAAPADPGVTEETADVVPTGPGPEPTAQA